jgi:hypothetical protein
MTKRLRKIPDRRAAIEGEVFTLPKKEGLQVVQPKTGGCASLVESSFRTIWKRIFIVGTSPAGAT